MSDFFARLAARTIEDAATVRPAIASRFAPIAAVELEESIASLQPHSPPKSLERTASELPAARSIAPLPVPPLASIEPAEMTAPQITPLTSIETTETIAPIVAPIASTNQSASPTAPVPPAAIEPASSGVQEAVSSVEPVTVRSTAIPTSSPDPIITPLNAPMLVDLSVHQPGQIHASTIEQLTIERLRSKQVTDSPKAASLEGLQPPAPATIRINIGRIEVRAIARSSSPARSPSPALPPPQLSLEDYLRRRNGGVP